MAIQTVITDRDIFMNESCDRAESWHYFTDHCDGSGCSYPGECEAA